MKHILFLISLSILLMGCDPRPIIDKFIKPKEKVEYNREYYPSRKLKRITETLNGMRHGTEKIYYENGKLKTLLHYQNNKLDGECIQYYENGEVRSKAIYTNNVKNGMVENYFPSGKVYSELPYLDGDLHGDVKKYYNTGKLMSRQTFQFGLPSTRLEEYDKTGKANTYKAKLQFDEVDEILMYNRFTVRVSFDKKNSKDVFYLGKLDENGAIPKTAQQIVTYNGVGEIGYAVPPGTLRMEPVYIIGVTNTPYRNKLVVEGKYNLSIKN